MADNEAPSCKQCSRELSDGQDANEVRKLVYNKNQEQLVPVRTIALFCANGCMDNFFRDFYQDDEYKVVKLKRPTP